ncbi:MAG TPA: hypothetical protein VGJ70_02720, partial [Solirubrobacteraceae bacterium]
RGGLRTGEGGHELVEDRPGLRRGADRQDEGLAVVVEARVEKGAAARLGVDDLIARAQAMRQWLQAATDCSCETLDVCALFRA